MSGFASTNDLADKIVSFDELGPGLYAYTAEGDPNSGIIVGPDGVVVVDAQATPAMAADVQKRIAQVTDREVNQIVLSHYHAVRVLGASGYPHAKGRIIASDVTRELIVERGQQDMDSEIGRFPRLFRGKESIPGLTWPTHTFQKQHDPLAGRAGGAGHPYRPRPHHGRHGGVAAEGEGDVRRRHGGVRRHALLRRRAFHRLAGDPRRDPRAGRREAGPRPRPRPC